MSYPGRHLNSHRRPFRVPLAGALLALLALGAAIPARAQNAIVLENQQPGNPASEWDIAGAGDLTIQGFATDISVNRGDTVHFKIKTDASAYHIDVYRLGYYQGNGARLVGAGVITASLPQAQPADLFDPVTGLTDCGNWAESAHWDVPATAVSGVYLAKLTRDDTQGASHIVFIVRDDASHSDVVVQTSDATWQAYNNYGGRSLYVGGADGPPALNHASKVSYNRPFYTRNGGGGGGAMEDWLFNSEYPMIRFLEANGYDLSYMSDVDTDRRGGLILNHRVWLESGHDEYWSGAARANVQAARDAGVHLAFFSGNEVYWKTRYEPSTDGSSTPYRTLVCYKEGNLGENQCNAKCDPLPGVWTGLWRDGCEPEFQPNDGCLPENALSGNISWDGTTGAIQVPDTFKNLRFWRNTAVARLGAGQTYPLPAGTLGYEWDWQQYDAFYPARRILLSSTVLDGHVHHLSLYRHSSGALVFSAGTVQWAWGLDSNHDRGNTPPDTSMQQATVNLLADMGVQPSTLIAGLVDASASSDALPPSSVISFPLDGASLPSGTPVNITGTATDAGGGVVAGVEVSLDGGTTWTAATGAANWSYVWTPVAQGPATIASRAYDDTGNLETPGGGEAPPNVVNVTVTAPAPPSCPCTVFQPTAVPLVVSDPDPSSNELGMKFRSSVAGFATGVRFYKGATNIGTHLGHLWASDGTMLAEVTFTGESATGWQEATFTNPVPIAAGTTYVVSYHSAGHYSGDNGGFATAIVNGPLRGLADGEDGPNGVYAPGAATAFPNQTFQQSNYWVDVVFNTAVGPDVTPPTVVALSPGGNATGVATTTSVTAAFSEAIDPATVDGTTVQLMDAANAPVAATVTYNVSARTAVLAPVSALAYSTAYTATVKGGGTDPRIKDLAGNALAADVTWSFTTGAPPPPPPTEGPGGPVLVISAATNPFGRYLAEVLRTEGLNEFSAQDISLVTPAVLAGYDVVVLGEQPLSPAQVTMLTDWTMAGGTLIAMRPDKQLAGLLGLSDANNTLSDRYLLVNTASGPGVGIVGQTIQFHGTADLYTLNGATSVATLYSNATTATSSPAVTMRGVGPSGGMAVAFTYDLARSVVYTRQGNPAWANQKRDGQIPPIRSDDQFFGNASFDPQADWIDLNKVAIPQADEQQRLLANLILQGNLHKKPLPRFWYLPKTWKAAIVMTGDNHGDAGMQPRFDIYRTESTANCSVDDWDCVRATGYEYVGSTFTDAQALFYHNLGFEVAVHVNTNCANFTQSEYQNFIATQFAQFHATFPSIPLPRTNRNHCIAWSDWSMTAETEVANGIRFDTNYYYWPQSWIQDRPGMFGGSGMCMRFAKLDGSMIDCFQAVTEMPDESGETFPQFCDALLDKANGPEGYYGIFTTNMHFDQANHAGSNAVVASAQAHGVPVVSAEQMLTWLDGRNSSSFGSLAWSGNQLTFTITTGTGSRNLEGMLPVLSAVGALTGLTRDGSAVAYTTQTVKGVQYAFFPAVNGAYTAQYLVDTTPPVISAVSAAPHVDGTASVTWTTDEASDSRVDYGTSADALTLHASSSVAGTSHALTLTGLAATTTYFYRVTSADGAGNAATSPALPASPQSFTMPAAVCASDRTTADFSAGTFDANAVATAVGDGEVALRPTLDEEFAGATLPAELQSAAWTTGGTATVGGGALSVNGAAVASNATFGPGSAIEFVATFGADPFENIGFAADVTFNNPWVTVGTGSGGAGVFARSNTSTDVSLGSGLLGTPHLYRIEWGASSFSFYVDGAATPAATLPLTIGGTMRAAWSDFNLNGTALTCDWLHATPYLTPGHFTSRVFDGGGPTNWGMLSWSADAPTGTSLTLDVRTGDTATPDGTWGAFTPIANGGSPGTTSRYLQYRATLATTVASQTPSLQDVSITCTGGTDTTPPVVTNIVAASAADGLSATITWSTNEPATSRVDYGTSAGALGSNAANAALVTAHGVTLGGLSPGVTYFYRVTSADAANNSATAPNPPAAPLSFTATAPTCAADASAADFGGGTVDAGTYVSDTAGGEVILAPAEGAEFGGAALPAGWEGVPYGVGGSAVVGGGQVAVDGARANTTALSYGPGRTLEFVATFDATASKQHAGFGNTLNESVWAIFSTGGSGGTLFARTLGSTTDDFALPAGFLGAPHRYRIAWNASTVDFYVDGALVHSSTNTVAGPLRPIAGDGNLDGVPLRVDWMRMSPYAAAGSYLSRVFTSGGISNWGQAAWSSALPAGTALAISVRTGNTATPDGTWTTFAALAGPGATVGAQSRYIQYKADLSTSDGTVTPALADLAVQCVNVPDTTPPVISSLVATPGASGTTASITWATDEPATSRVDYGTAPGALTSFVSDPGPVTSHVLGLGGLAPLTTYFYRVTSVDGSNNAATSPNPPAAPASFTTSAPPCPSDQALADFGAGTFGANTTPSLAGDGEVILTPAFLTEFNGGALPAGWVTGNTSPWTGGTATVAGGSLTVNGAHAASGTTFGPGSSLEFVATFRADGFENVGLSGDAGFNNPWITIGEPSAGDGVYARSYTGAAVSLGTGLLDAPHRYRIEWGATSFAFYVDGAITPAATLAQTIATNMVVQVSDLNLNANALAVDWLRVGPYAAAGSFTSRVFDGSGPTNWGAATWTADLPAGTSLGLFFRTGATAVPDGSWSAFAGVANNGSVGLNSRYVQYRADLATTNLAVTPALNDLTIACAAGPDNVPPSITNVVATPAADGQSATVTWTTSEPADSRVDYGTSAALGASAGSATLVLSHSVLLGGLSPGTTYSYRVTSADAASNSTTSPTPPTVLTFFAPAPTCFTEQTAADFAAGTPSSTYLSSTGDGEVILQPTSGTEFSGTTLPAGWQSALWSGGTSAAVSGGQLGLIGAHAATTATFGPGRSLEFAATFRGKANEHIGFATDFSFNSPWALFSTVTSTTQLSARVNVAGTDHPVSLPAVTLGVPHTFRIDWNTSNFVFWVDGTQVATISFAITTNMVVAASDLGPTGLAMNLDWVRVTPYAAAGSFVSAVHDGGGPTRWLNATWTSTVPASTSLALSVRTGNTPAPDGTWSAYQAVASPGTSVGLCGRYVQYKADLATTAPGSTPVLDAFALACGPDAAPGPAVTNLAAAIGTGNDTSGRTKVLLTWSGGASGVTTSVYRKAFGDYPLYRGTVGVTPAAPASPAAALAAGWTLTGVTAPGQTDLPPTRDDWHYVLFQLDACGSSSTVSNRVAIPNYLLGDVSDGTTQCQGDNVVNVGDLSFLGAHYGASLGGPADPLACLDVGPTTDFSTHGRPQPDGVLDFEDLIMFGLDYSGASLPAMVAGRNGLSAASGSPVQAAAPADDLTLDVPALPGAGDSFELSVRARGAGDAYGLSVELGFDPAVVEQLAVTPGALLGQQAAPSLTLSPRAGRVDVALLGAAGGLAGDGELARVRFRVRSPGNPRFEVRHVDARDRANGKLAFGAAAGPVAEAAPARTELGAVYPNPFRHDLSVELRLNQAARVKLAVYDVAGRLVRTLDDGVEPAGRRTVVWDGQGRTGVRLASGYYVLRFQAGRIVQTRPVWLIR